LSGLITCGVTVDLNDQRNCRSVAKLRRPSRLYPARCPIAAALAKPTNLLTMLLSAIVRIYTERHYVSSPTWRTRSKRRADYTDPSQLAKTVSATPNEVEYEKTAASLAVGGSDTHIDSYHYRKIQHVMILRDWQGIPQSEFRYHFGTFLVAVAPE
jgi:hypothetical protein